MRHVFVPMLVAALAASGVMFSTVTFARDAGQATARDSANAAAQSAGVLSIHDLSPQRTHQHSAPRAQFGRTPIRGHGDAFVFASMQLGWRAGMEQARLNPDRRFARYRTLHGAR